MEIELCGEFSEQDVQRAVALGYGQSFRAFRVIAILGLALVVVYNIYLPMEAIIRGELPLEPAILFGSLLPAVLLLLWQS
jgi:hypothetical protein